MAQITFDSFHSFTAIPAVLDGGMLNQQAHCTKCLNLPDVTDISSALRLWH